MQPERPFLHPEGIQYPYRILGEGGEHVVLNEPYWTQAAMDSGASETDDGDMFVRKYSRLALYACNADLSLPPSDRYALATARAERTNERFAALERQFPTLVARQSSVGNIVHLTDSEIAYLWGSDHNPLPPAGIYATVLTFQDRIPALMHTPPTVQSIDIPYAEMYGPPVDPEVYAAVNQRFLVDLNGNRPLSTQEMKDFYTVQGNGSIFPLPYGGAIRGHVSRGLRAFGWYAAEFTHLTGEILDLAGPNNAVMNEYGEFTLVDALYPADIPVAQRVPDILHKVQAGKGLTFQDQANLLNGLGYMRTINFLLACYGQDNFIDTLAGSDIKPGTWKTVYSYLSRLSTGAALRRPTGLYAE